MIARFLTFVAVLHGLFCAGFSAPAYAQVVSCQGPVGFNSALVFGGASCPSGGGGGGGPSVKQTAHAINTAGGLTTFNATFGSGISSGSIIAVAAFWNSGTTGTLADGSSDTVTDSGAGTIADGNVNSSVVKAFLTPTAGVTTVTLTLTATTQYVHLVIWEIAGYTGSVTFDQVAHTTGINANSVSTGALAQANEIGIAYAENSNASFTPSSLSATPGTFSLDYDDTVQGTASNQAGHVVTSATSALTATITIGFNFMTIWLVTFK